MNLVLDDVKEVMRGGHLWTTVLWAFLLMRLADDEGNESSRSLGLIVARGTLLVLIAPVDGSEEIANPFHQVGEE
jgi:U6 snRNA-associated Sm-like protein LSm7